MNALLAHKAANEIKAFLSIERSLGALAYDAMAPTAHHTIKGIKSAIDEGNFALAHERSTAVDFGKARSAIEAHGEIYLKSAYLLGASRVYGSLRRLPSNVSNRIPKHAIDNTLSVHAGIVGQRSDMLVKRSLGKLVGRAEAAHRERGYRRKLDGVVYKDAEDDVADALNAAVDGTAKMMSSISANLSTSRLVSYGFLVEADANAMVEYRLQAILDDRTSDICIALDGRTFQVRQSLDYMNQVMESSDPEALKSIAPFLKSSADAIDELQDLSDEELQTRGVMCPPFHPHCRTILVPAEGVVETTEGEQTPEEFDAAVAEAAAASQTDILSEGKELAESGQRLEDAIGGSAASLAGIGEAEAEEITADDIYSLVTDLTDEGVDIPAELSNLADDADELSQDDLASLEAELEALRPDTTSKSSVYKMAVQSIAQKFNPTEARDDHGKWTQGTTGGTEAHGLSGRGIVPGSAGQLAASGGTNLATPLTGLSPTKVTVSGQEIKLGPIPHVREVAANYMRDAGLSYDPPKTYVKVDPVRAKRIADEFDKMKDDPHDPDVAAAYGAMAQETLAQYHAAVAGGLRVDFIDGPDPYAASPRLAVEDVKHNNHMSVFPTDAGFGHSAITPEMESRNPLLAQSGEFISGRPARLNDIFRAVHDYFGHAKEGVGFRADGEENAWRSHSAMYTPLARRAMTTETRGQNSWVNYGPHGEANRSASTANTVFAEQKIGLMPKWVSEEGAHDMETYVVGKSNTHHDEKGRFTTVASNPREREMRGKPNDRTWVGGILSPKGWNRAHVEAYGHSHQYGSHKTDGVVIVEKYNPNHVASGPQGGQFTTGGGVHGGKGVHFNAIASVQSIANNSLKDLLAKKASIADISSHPDIQKAMARMMAIEPTDKKSGYGSAEWKANRQFNIKGQTVIGYEAGTNALISKAESYAGNAGPAAERQAFMIIGPPASGKSNLSETVAKEYRAAIVDSDDAKAILPEFQGGIGANAVHMESGALATLVQNDQIYKGNNAIFPMVGATAESIKARASLLTQAGYTVNLISMKVPADVAFRNMIGRFAKTGRLVNPEYSLWVDSKPDKVFNEEAKYDPNIHEAMEFSGNYRGKEPLNVSHGAETTLAKRVIHARGV